MTHILHKKPVLQASFWAHGKGWSIKCKMETTSEISCWIPCACDSLYHIFLFIFFFPCKSPPAQLLQRRDRAHWVGSNSVFSRYSNLDMAKCLICHTSFKCITECRILISSWSFSVVLFCHNISVLLIDVLQGRQAGSLSLTAVKSDTKRLMSKWPEHPLILAP